MSFTPFKPFSTYFKRRAEEIIKKEFDALHSAFNDIAATPSEVDSNALLSHFKEIASHPFLLQIIREKREESMYELLEELEDINILNIFRITAKNLHPNDIIDMARHMVDDEIFNSIAPKSSSFVMHDILKVMVENCPAHQKRTLLNIFQEFGYGEFLQNALWSLPSYHSVEFFGEFLDNLETNEESYMLHELQLYRPLLWKNGFMANLKIMYPKLNMTKLYQATSSKIDPNSHNSL